MRDVMIDLETCGTTPGSIILSIGAVAMDFETGNLGSEFYSVIGAASSERYGMTMSFDTMRWWSEQSPEAKQVLHQCAKASNPVSLPLVLDHFKTYLSAYGPDVRIWGNGAAFDNVLLADAYNRIGLALPWKFWNDRCYRTVKNLFPDVEFDGVAGTAHNALDDARSQALHLLKIASTMPATFQLMR